MLKIILRINLHPPFLLVLLRFDILWTKVKDEAWYDEKICDFVKFHILNRKLNENQPLNGDFEILIVHIT